MQQILEDGKKITERDCCGSYKLPCTPKLVCCLNCSKRCWAIMSVLKKGSTTNPSFEESLLVLCFHEQNFLDQSFLLES